MPPVISQFPNQVSFSRNEILLQINSADYRDSVPVVAVNRLNILAALSADDTIQLQWSGNLITMTAKAAPDDSAEQFPVGDGSNSYVQSLVAIFQANYFIQQYFTVTADVTGSKPALIFTALSTGTASNFTASTTAKYSIANITPGTDGGLKQNFAHHIELLVRNAADSAFDVAYNANVPLDEPVTGKTTIDIHDAIHSYLSHDVPVMASLYQACVNTVRRYMIKYAAMYGDDPSIKQVNLTTALFYAVRGGLSLKAATQRNIVTELCPVNGDHTQDLFMRQGSKSIYVTRDQPEWLSWLNLTGIDQTVSLEVVLHNADGSFTTITPVAGLTIKAYQKYQFQAGFAQLNLSSAQGAEKTIAFYTARLKNSANSYLTSTYTYTVDDRYWSWSRFFVYENAYGSYQTLATVGKGQTGFDRTKTDSQRSATQLYKATAGDLLECNISFQDKGTVAIGYQRANDRTTKLLRSFFVSELIYLYQSGKLTPIGINTKTLNDKPDGENVYANSFEYFIKYQETSYTEDPGVSDDAASPVVPAQYNMYYGASVAMPATIADVQALSSAIFSSPVTLNTGSAYRYFSIVIEHTRSISSVTDLDSYPIGDITSLYKLRGNVTISGKQFDIYTMINGLPYKANHRHQFNLI